MLATISTVGWCDTPAFEQNNMGLSQLEIVNPGGPVGSLLTFSFCQVASVFVNPGLQNHTRFVKVCCL